MVFRSLVFFSKNYLFLRLTNHQKNKTEEQGNELSDLEIQKTPTKYVDNKLKKYCITNRLVCGKYFFDMRVKSLQLNETC